MCLQEENEKKKTKKPKEKINRFFSDLFDVFNEISARMLPNKDL